MHNIPEQAIEAALDKWRDHEFDGTLDTPRMRAAIAAAAPHMSGVKVKQLEWVEIPACNDLNTAKTQFGTYTIGSSLVVRYGAKSISKPLANLEEAKVAAQADYEKRILSALEPSAARELALEALMSAEQFIENGFEFGFIRKPDEGDPALETLPKIKAAIRALSSPDHADDVADHFQKDSESLSRLRLRGYVTDSQRDAIIKKLFKSISTAVISATHPSGGDRHGA